MSDVELSKRHDTDLWREFAMSLKQPSFMAEFEKIKTISMAEFALDKFRQQ